MSKTKSDRVKQNEASQELLELARQQLVRASESAAEALVHLQDIGEPSQTGIRDNIQIAMQSLEAQNERLEGYLEPPPCWVCHKTPGNYDEGMCFECMTAVENGAHHLVMAPLYIVLAADVMNIFVRSTESDGTIQYERLTKTPSIPVVELALSEPLSVVDVFNWIANASEAGADVAAFYTPFEYEHGFREPESETFQLHRHGYECPGAGTTLKPQFYLRPEAGWIKRNRDGITIDTMSAGSVREILRAEAGNWYPLAG